MAQTLASTWATQQAWKGINNIMKNIEVEIIKEKEKLLDEINKYGCNSSKVLKQSQKCDKLILEITKKQVKKRVF